MRLSAEHAEAKFGTLTVEKPLPGAKLPSIKPDSFRLAGVVEAVESAPKPEELIVAFVKESKVATTAAVSVNDGHFESFLPSGTYVIEVRRGNQREEAFKADQSSVKVLGPVADLRFTVATYTVSGVMKCFKTPCNEGLSLYLRHSRGNVPVEVKADGTFNAKSIRHGGYELRIDDPSRCWETTTMKLNVDQNKEVKVSQKGRALTVESSLATTLELHDGSKIQRYDVSPGSNRFCVDGDRDLEVRTDDGCYRFEANPSVVKTGVDKVVLIVSSYQFVGTIISDSPVKGIKLFAQSGNDRKEIELTKTSQGYSFSLLMKKDERLKLEPTSQEAFFEPAGEVVLKPGGSCEDNKVSFTAKKGIFVEGRIQPPVEGVAISVVDKPQKTATTRDGTFRIGPFRDEKEASSSQLSAEKEGYHFEAVERTLFAAKKLSSIEISATDENGRPLPNEAVVSISDTTGGNFRTSEHMKEGVAHFPSLLPGEYYVRVVLKEWLFEPKSIVINLGEHENAKRTVSGKRVAYSLHGSLQYMNGRPATNVVVLAAGQAPEQCVGQIEDATSGMPSGEFRLRGLQPGCKYELQPGDRTTHTFIFRQGANFTMGEADHRMEAPVLAQEASDVFHIAVLVKAKDDQQTYQVSVEGRSGEKPVSKVFSVSPNRMTVLPALPAGNTGQLTVSIPRVSPAYVTPEAASFRYLTFEIRDEDSPRRRGKTTSSSGVALAMFVGAIIAGGFLYQRSLKDRK